MRYDYIPDLTERFPEGFDGVDMTPSFYGEPVDWSRALREDDYEEYEEEVIDTEPRKFVLGETYRDVGIFGGVTYYTVEEINREENKILLSEIWEDVDGTGKRPSKWHRLEIDENGNEKAFNWKSETYGEIWILA
jgi:hypothetical protein